MICPNINSQEFKALVAKHGLKEAYAINAYGLANEDLNTSSNTVFVSKTRTALTEFLRGLNINVQENQDELLDTLKLRHGNPMSAFDTLQKFLALRSDITDKDLALQSANIMYTFLGKKSKLGVELWKGISNWSGYEAVYNKYNDKMYESISDDQSEEIEYKREGFNAWAHKQVIINFIADALVTGVDEGYIGENAPNPDLNKQYFEDKGYKNKYEKNLIRNIYNQIYNWIQQNIFNNEVVRNLDETALTDLVMGIVNDVYNKDYHKWLRHITDKDGEYIGPDGSVLEQKEYDSTLDKDPFAKDIIERLTNNPFMGYKLSGSQTIRKYGLLLRPESEDLHDIDGVIPVDTFRNEENALAFKYWLDTRGLELIGKNKQDQFQKEIQIYLEDQAWYKNLKDMYPTWELTAAFIGRDHKNAESVTITGQVDHPSKVDEMGNPEKYILDFFLRTDEGNYPEIFDNYWKDWKQIFEAKLNMGRAKDIADMIYFQPFKQDKYKFTNKGFRFFTFADDIMKVEQNFSKDVESDFAVEDDSILEQHEQYRLVESSGLIGGIVGPADQEIAANSLARIFTEFALKNGKANSVKSIANFIGRVVEEQARTSRELKEANDFLFDVQNDTDGEFTEDEKKEFIYEIGEDIKFLSKKLELFKAVETDLRSKDSKIITQAKNKLRGLQNFKLRDDNNTEIDIDQDNREEAVLDRTSRYDDNFIFFTDSRRTISSNLRMFLATIPKQRKNKNGELVPYTDIYGGIITIDFNEGYEELKRVLTDTPPDFALMKAKILAYVGTGDDMYVSKSWMLSLLDRLEGSENSPVPIETRAEFVSDMTTHYISMRVLTYTRRWVASGNRSGYWVYDLGVRDANQAAMSSGTMMQWANNLKDSGLLIYDGDSDDYIYNLSDDDRIRIKDKYDKLTNGRPSATLLNDYLSEFGINMDPVAIDNLMSKDKIVLTNGLKLDYEQLKNGGLADLQSAFMRISDLAKTRPVKYSVETLIHQTSIYSLAQINAKYTPELFVNSFNLGNKSIHAYGNNKFAMDRARNLLNNQDGILDTFSRTVYVRNSWQLRELIRSNPNAGEYESSNFRNWFKIGYVSLDPISQLASKSLNELSEAEQEFHKQGIFWNNLSWVNGEQFRERKTTYYYPTSSDKSTVLEIDGVAFQAKYNTDGSLHNSMLDLIIDNIVSSEFDRIKATKKSGKPGDSLFYFFPEMNNYEVEINSSDGKTKIVQTLNNVAAREGTISKEVKGILRGIVSNRIEALTSEKTSFWADHNIGNTTYNPETGSPQMANSFLDNKAVKQMNARLDISVSSDVKNEKGAKHFMAKEMVFNYMFNLGNTFQLFVGDMALYHKQDKDARKVVDKNGKKLTEEQLNERDYISTLDNLGKRMAAEIAPGYSLSNEVYNEIFGTTEYIQLYGNDVMLSSSEDQIKYYNKLFKHSNHKYDGIESTDGQEYTTWREHLTIMLASGRLSRFKYDNLIDKLSNGKELSQKELQTVLNPLKPVYTNSKEYNVGSVLFQKRNYIKSSSFPLLPQLTKGLQLDGLRAFMENIESTENRPVRFAYASAVKVGLPSVTGQLFDKDGNLNELISYSVDDSKVTKKKIKESNIAYETLDRNGFRIQQDVPFKADKSEVNVGSQESKLLFNNLLGITEKIFNYNNKKYSGQELKDEYDKLLQLQFTRKYDKFKNRFTIDGEVKIEKLAAILEEELFRTAQPTVSEKDGLAFDTTTNEFITPLWLSPHSKKYSQLINSLLNTSLIERKTRGSSVVLGADMGFKISKDEEDNNEPTGITYTDSYNGVNLLPQRPGKKKGEILPAQVLIRFPFKDINGKDLKLSEFLKEDGTIDNTKLPPELLKTFSFRIPTQSHSSMSSVEIVGFLPPNMGDLVIAPKEFVNQMGSDFDVDKLYNYFFNTYITPGDGVLHKIEYNAETRAEDLDAAIQNEILNIHFTIMDNEVAQAQVVNPLGFGQLAKYKNLMAKDSDSDLQSTYISDEYNRKKFMNGVSGQSGTGFFAQATVFNSMTQSSDLYMYKNRFEYGEIVGRDRLELSFGNDYTKWDGDLSNPYSMKKENRTLKSGILAAFLSAAVDNEKEQLLGDLNINSHTFAVIGFLIQSGYEEDIILPFINQPSIKAYINEISKEGSILSSKEGSKKERIAKIASEVLGRYDNSSTVDLSNFSGISAKDKMLELIHDQDANDYSKYQHDILAKFLEISDDMVPIYNKALPLSNVDSKTLGKDLTESSYKSEKLRASFENTAIIKINEIDKAFRESPSGMAYENYMKGLESFKSLYVHISDNEGFIKMVENLAEVKAIDVVDLRYDEYDELVESIKYFTLSRNSHERDRLINGQESLLTRLKAIENTDYFKSNKFLSKLNLTNDSKKRTYDGVSFNRSLSNEFSDTLIYQGFIDAITSNKIINDVNITDLMEDLIKYSILDGARYSPQTFSRFIPPVYFEKLGINDYARSINMDKHSDYILEQYIQHNFKSAIKVLGKQKVENGVNTFTMSEREVKRLGYEPLYVYHGTAGKERLFKKDGDGVYIQIDILGDKKTILEYSYPNSLVARTAISKNKSKTTPENFPVSGVGHTEEGDQFELENDPGLKPMFANTAEDIGLTEEPQSLYYVLQKIDDPIAKSMVNLFETRLKNVSIQLDPNMVGSGVYSNKSIRINPFLLKYSSIKLLVETIVHESTHAITSYILYNRASLNDEQTALVNKILAYRVELVKKIAGNKSEVDKFIRSMKYTNNFKFNKNSKDLSPAERLIDANRLVLDKLRIYKGIDPDIDQLLIDLENQTPTSILNADTSDLFKSNEYLTYYGLLNDNEFLATISSNEHTQKFINAKFGSINGIEKIKELFIQLFESLGILNKASSEIIQIMFDVALIQDQVLDYVPNQNLDTGIVGFNSNLYTRKTKDEGKTHYYENDEGDILTTNRLNNLKRLKNYNRDGIFPMNMSLGSYGELLLYLNGDFITDDGLMYNSNSFKDSKDEKLNQIKEFLEITDIYPEGTTEVGSYGYTGYEYEAILHTSRLELIAEFLNSPMHTVKGNDRTYWLRENEIIDSFGNIYKEGVTDSVDRTILEVRNLFNKKTTNEDDMIGSQYMSILAKERLMTKNKFKDHNGKPILQRVPNDSDRAKLLKRLAVLNAKLPPGYRLKTAPLYVGSKYGGRAKQSTIVVLVEPNFSDSNPQPIDLFTPITGATYLNELNDEDMAYMLELAALGLIEINC